jgi:hypothetical protein
MPAPPFARRFARSVTVMAACIVLGVLAARPAFPYAAVQNKADNTEIRIVPAPGKVVVDGKLDDWDRSGEIFMFIDEASRESHHVKMAMMYDKDFVYVGGHWKDPTPMRNVNHFGGDVANAWNADAIQIRFISDPAVKSDASNITGGRMPAEQQKFVNHINLWYSTQDKKAGYEARYTLNFADEVVNPPGLEGAFVEDADGKGCTFEYKIPLTVLRAPRPYKGGDDVQMQFQIHWGNELGTELKSGITDVRNPRSNTLGYMGPAAWGLGRFMDKGNLPPPPKSGTERAAGHIPVKFTMPRDGKASISIRNAAGRTIRTGIGAVPFKAGEQTWMWDGLDDFDRPVPAGTYEAKILTHDGIGQKFVCDVGTSGTPPWQTEDGTGGWAGDYWAPTFVATEGDRVILGTGNFEAQKATIGTDLEGKKLWGTTATGLALALRNGFGYFGNNGNLTKFRLTDGQLSPFADGRPTAKVPVNRGLAALDDRTLVTANGEPKLFLVDSATGKQTGEVATPVPLTGGLAVDGKGVLYAVSENAMGRVDAKSGGFTPIAKDLDEPKMLACDASGHVYVSLQGKTMQVWKLDASGKAVQKFGKAGGRPLLDAFDAAAMLNPYAIAVDKSGRLWVAEDDRFPKRYSAWNADGTLFKDFFGSMPYSTGGSFDPKDPEQVYAYNVRYVVDYDKGTWRPDGAILRTREENGVVLPEADYHSGGRVVARDGRKFMLVNGTMSTGGPTLYEEVGGKWVPRMAHTPARGKGKNRQPAVDWRDANNDGRVQDDEKQPGLSRIMTGRQVVIDGRLNLWSYRGDTWLEPTGPGKRTQPFDIVRLDFLGFGPKGELRYADQPKAMAHDDEGGAFNGTCADDDGSSYALLSGGLLGRGERAQGSGARLVKYGPDGKERWRYTNVHPGFAWTSNTYTPGFAVAAFRMDSAQHPDLLPVTSYYGQYYLIDKQDGLFVDALGQDQRSAYTLDHTMVLTENFNGEIFKHPKTGKTYFTGGDADCRIWELTGLDSIGRATVKITVDAALLAQAAKNGEQNQKAGLTLQAKYAGGRKSAVIPQLSGAAADGSDGEWHKVAPLPIGDDPAPAARVQFGHDAKNLYARFEVTSAVPFVNTPSDFRQLFKSGSGLEICLTPKLDERKVGPNNRHPMEVGDLRVVIGRTKDGKLVATRYRPKIEANEKPLAAFFETPSAGRENFDEIAEWNELPMHYQAIPGGYVVEVAIPWAATAVKPAKGAKFLLDAGLIGGNEGGTRNATRSMWSDRAPEVNVNNDIPTESRMHPNGWGLVELE